MVKLLFIGVSGLEWVTFGAKISQGKLNEKNFKDYIYQNWWRFGKHMYWLLSSVAYGHPALNYESLLEQIDIRIVAVVPRYISHQIVRHRHISVVQESQRYTEWRVNSDNIAYLCDTNGSIVKEAVERARDYYLMLREKGVPPERARAVLPECTKTVILVKTNLRELLHIMELRLAARAQAEHATLWSMVADRLRTMYIPVAHLLVLKSPIVYEEAKKLGRIHSYRDEKFAWLGANALPGMTLEQAKHLRNIIDNRKDLPEDFKEFVNSMYNEIFYRQYYKEGLSND